MTWIREQLLATCDEGYKDFQCKLMPTVDQDTVIGVRTPALRKLAKEFAKRNEANDFLHDLPHRYYEENNVHACLIESMKDYGACVAALDEFLPYVDNWATCDMMTPRVLGKHKRELLTAINRWMASGHTYTVRFGIKMLMTFYLDGDFDPAYLARVAAVRSEEYYVNMMVAWYFATALAKQWTATVPYIENRRLPPWVHGKAIQKAVESYRITDGQKAYLRTLRGV